MRRLKFSAWRLHPGGHPLRIMKQTIWNSFIPVNAFKNQHSFKYEWVDGGFWLLCIPGCLGEDLTPPKGSGIGSQDTVCGPDFFWPEAELSPYQHEQQWSRLAR